MLGDELCLFLTRDADFRNGNGWIFGVERLQLQTEQNDLPAILKIEVYDQVPFYGQLMIWLHVISFSDTERSSPLKKCKAKLQCQQSS